MQLWSIKQILACEQLDVYSPLSARDCDAQELNISIAHKRGRLMKPMSSSPIDSNKTSANVLHLAQY